MQVRVAEVLQSIYIPLLQISLGPKFINQGIKDPLEGYGYLWVGLQDPMDMGLKLYQLRTSTGDYYNFLKNGPNISNHFFSNQVTLHVLDSNNITGFSFAFNEQGVPFFACSFGLGSNSTIKVFTINGDVIFQADGKNPFLVPEFLLTRDYYSSKVYLIYMDRNELNIKYVKIEDTRENGNIDSVPPQARGGLVLVETVYRNWGFELIYTNSSKRLFFLELESDHKTYYDYSGVQVLEGVSLTRSNIKIGDQYFIIHRTEIGESRSTLPISPIDRGTVGENIMINPHRSTGVFPYTEGLVEGSSINLGIERRMDERLLLDSSEFLHTINTNSEQSTNRREFTEGMNTEGFYSLGTYVSTDTRDISESIINGGSTLFDIHTSTLYSSFTESFGFDEINNLSIFSSTFTVSSPSSGEVLYEDFSLGLSSSESSSVISLGNSSGEESLDYSNFGIGLSLVQTTQS